ncbi:MAG TPA: methylated-DNA--[protein]-cysteine S-methyltransferase, partial [Ferruginibacter sp.]|nr:methylated-DNA--[protein]-cysteine S-methyltransferase [Ferruginibacter sp.]
LQIKNSGDFITEISFVETQKKGNTGQQINGNTNPSTPILKKCVEQLEAYFSGQSLQFNLSLSQEGTPFQQTVWTELQKIPYGRTVSYLHLSKSLGNVKAIRAVGTANGKNNIVIIVPCHRVIGSDGKLVGYGGDLWRKHWLLEHEAKFANGVQHLF